MDYLENLDFNFNNIALNNLKESNATPSISSEAVDREQKLNRETQEQIDYGLDGGDLIDSAMRDNSVGYMTYISMQNHAQDSYIEKDENFDVNTMLTDKIKYDIHPSYLGSLADRAKSEDHFNKILPYYKRISAEKRFMESQGMLTQFGAGALAELTNIPLYYGMFRAAPLLMNRLGSTMASRFVAGGTGGVALEALKDIIGEDDKQALDYAFAFGFDGAMASIFGGRMMKTGQDIVDESVKRTSGVTKEVEEKLAKTTDEEARKTIIREAYQAKQQRDIDDTLLTKLDTLAKESSKNVVQKAWTAARQDIAYVTGKSESDTFSNFSRQLFPDATLQNLDRNALDFQTETLLLEDQMRAARKEIIESKAYRYAEIVQRSKLDNIRPTTETVLEFSRLIGSIQSRKMLFGETSEEAIKSVTRGMETTKELNDLLMESSKSMEELSLKYHKMFGDFGHSDFKSGAIKENPNYMPISYNKNALNALLEDGVHKRDIEAFFAEAIEQNNPNLSPEVVRLIAQKFIQAIQTTNLNKQNTFNSVLDDLLSSDQFTDEASAAIKRNRKIADENKSSNAQARSDINYGHKKKVITKDGREREISFENLIDNDYINIMENYTRKMAGSTVLRNFTFKSSKKILSREQFDELVNADEELVALRTKLEEATSAKNLSPEDMQIAELTLNNIISRLHKNSNLYKELSDLVEKGDIDEILNYAYSNIDKIAKAAKVTDEDLAPILPIIEKITKSLDNADIQKINDLIEERIDFVKSDMMNKYYDNAGNLEIKTSIERAIKEEAKYQKILDNINNAQSKDILLHEIEKSNPELAAKVADAYDMMNVEPHNKAKYNEEANKYIKEATDELEAKIKKAGDFESLIPKRYKSMSKDIIEVSRQSEEFFRNLASTAWKQVDAADANRAMTKAEREELFNEYYGSLKDKNKAEIKAIDSLVEDAFGGLQRDLRLEKKSDFEEFENVVQSELRQKVEQGLMTEDNAKKELIRLKTIMKDMLGEPTMKDGNSALAQAQRIIHGFNIGRLLGQTVWTMTGELGSVMVDAGVKNTLREIPTFFKLLKAYKTGNFDDPVIKELQDTMGIFNEFMSGSRLNEYNHEFNALTGTGKKTADKLERFSENFAEFTLMTGGVKPLTAWFQAVHARSILRKMKEVSTKFDDTYGSSSFTFPDVIKSKTGINIVAKNVGKGNIHISKDSAEWDRFFAEKNWTKPRVLSDGSSAEALPENQFKDVDEVKEFVIEHEISHNKILRKENETLGAYETRVNNEALRRIKERNKTLHGNGNYRKLINELGLSKEMEIAVYKEIQKHSVGTQMNFDKWDTEVKNRFMGGMKRRSDTIVQTQRLGDKPAWVRSIDNETMLKDTVEGKFAMELKTFIFTAYVKQLGRSINRRDAYIAAVIAAQTALLTASYMGKQYYNYSGNQEKFDKAMTPDAIAGGVAGMLPPGSFIPAILDMISGELTGEQIFGSTRHNSQIVDILSSFASLDFVENVLGVAGIPEKIISDGFDVKDLNPLLNITGLSNNVLTKPIVEAARAE